MVGAKRMRRNPLQTVDGEAAILRQVRASVGISRMELARELGLAPSTAGVYVERLIKEGLLLESEKAERESGRPPTLLRLNPAGGEFVGVDFEASTLMATAVDFSDRPLRSARRSIKSTDSVEGILRKVEAATAEVLPRDASKLLAIGVGVPGTVDSARGVAMHYKYIERWRNVPLAERMRKIFGIPVFLESNVRSMALAELWFGQGKGVSDFLSVVVRSGVGVGVIVNGQLCRGANQHAGQIGYSLVPISDPEMAVHFESAQGRSLFELQEVVSVRAIRNALARAAAAGRKKSAKAPPPASVDDIVAALDADEGQTRRIVGTAARTLAFAVVQQALVLDPAKVILAGPVTAFGEYFRRPLEEAVAEQLGRAGWRDALLPVENSQMGEYSGALGAAALAVHEWKPRR